jgi:5-formyltetrahydrofolate cyclo-ligase
MREKLRDVPPFSQRATAALIRWLTAHPALRTIATYSWLPGEVDLSESILARPDIFWVYPKITDDRLSFHHGRHLTRGSFGILEPQANTPEISISEIDAFLCPGFAFDPNGGRLGRGRGYYDRMLARARPDALKIGICFDFQLVPDTFSEPHDIPMDEVIF